MWSIPESKFAKNKAAVPSAKLGRDHAAGKESGTGFQPVVSALGKKVAQVLMPGVIRFCESIILHHERLRLRIRADFNPNSAIGDTPFATIIGPRIFPLLGAVSF